MKKRRYTPRTGTPVRSGEDDLFEAFTGSRSEAEQDAYLSDLLEDALAGKKHREMLREKGVEENRKNASSIRAPLRNYPEVPQDEIDLHGLTARQAEDTTDSFIRSARQEALKTVRVIVGKGLHSEGRPVLPGVVEKKLSELKKHSVVAAFTTEKGRKKRSGAFIVYLSR